MARSIFVARYAKGRRVASSENTAPDIGDVCATILAVAIAPQTTGATQNAVRVHRKTLSQIVKVVDV
jgi:hypothetical protein